jgi:hypothetical protein
MNSAQELLKEKQALGRNPPVMKTVSEIPTAHMHGLTSLVRSRLVEKKSEPKGNSCRSC